MTLIERFWMKVDKSNVAGCWMWIGAGSRQRRAGCLPYGLFCGGDIKPNRTRRLIPAHRFIYSVTYGPIPPGLVVCHRCETYLCVRPDHLFLGTQRDNLADMQRKGRKADSRGEMSGHAVLTAVTVDQIRARFASGNISGHKLAAEFGVGPKTINDVLLLKTWRHTEGAKHFGPLRTRQN